jgi:hypothetical protein
LPGQRWEREILKAIRATEVVLICLSQDSINTEGYVQREIKLALDAADEKPEDTVYLIPVKLEECELPISLQQWHAVNLYKEGGYESLKRALQLRAIELGIDEA